MFLEEIHLLSVAHQHSLLQVLDKRRIFVNCGNSVTAIPVAPFTLVGATTDPDRIIDPLRDRFRIVLHLDYYSHQELAAIVKVRLRTFQWDYGPELIEEIAKRARGTPRIALRLLQSARRVQVLVGSDVLTVECLQKACEVERISDLGADSIQQKLMGLLGNGPERVGVLASMLGVSTKVLQKTVEPFLLRQGLIVKTDMGLRTLTESGRRHWRLSVRFLSAIRPNDVKKGLGNRF